MRGDRAEGLEVHREALGRALRPELRLLLVGDRVIRGVVLDEREVLGVETQARVGLLGDVVGVPAGVDKRGVGPGAGPDEDLLVLIAPCRHRAPGRAPPPLAWSARGPT